MIMDPLDGFELEPVGRAAAGIYAIMKGLFNDAEVMVPANICPVAVYPIVYSGNRPVFCDVDVQSGNVSLNLIRAAMTDRIRAVLVPHMYGNPVSDIASISVYCREHDILLIEDCSLAMGSEIEGRPIGSFGDYAVYSTGYAKILDLGGGGLIASRKIAPRVHDILAGLPEKTPQSDEVSSLFSVVYRRFLNTRRPLADFGERAFFATDLRPMIIYAASPEYKRTVQDEISSKLRDEIQRRRNAYRRLSSLISPNVRTLKSYFYEEGSVPWRYSFFIRSDFRQNVADALLAEKLPVSDWYPAIHELFEGGRSYLGAEEHGKTILNLPLDLSDEEIDITCRTLNKIMCH